MQRSECGQLGVAARMAALLALSLAVAVVANGISPRGIAWLGTGTFSLPRQAAQAGVEIVDLVQARSVVKEQASIILDARSPGHFKVGHLPGALSLPLAAFEAKFTELQSLLTPEQPVMVYCSGPACDEALRLAQMLRQQGLQRVALFEGGMEAWTGGKLEVEVGE